MSSNYLHQNYDYSDPELVLNIDELALWSAPSGLKLLETIEMKPGINVLDIGPGSGFPMIELAQRLGDTSRIFGIDPWDAAIGRVNQKIAFHELMNVSIQHARAETIPFSNKFFDLIVSNNGLNNVEDVEKSFSECYRVSKSGAQMVFTVNLPDTFVEFYTIFRQTLKELNKDQYLKNIDSHINHKRKPLEFWQELAQANGFSIKETSISDFNYKFASGSALLRYSTFRFYFLDGWKNCVDISQTVEIFKKLEFNLNSYALENNGIVLTVPFVCFDLRRT